MSRRSAGGRTMVAPTRVPDRRCKTVAAGELGGVRGTPLECRPALRDSPLHMPTGCTYDATARPQRRRARHYMRLPASLIRSDADAESVKGCATGATRNGSAGPTRRSNPRHAPPSALGSSPASCRRDGHQDTDYRGRRQQSRRRPAQTGAGASLKDRLLLSIDIVH